MIYRKLFYLEEDKYVVDTKGETVILTITLTKIYVSVFFLKQWYTNVDLKTFSLKKNKDLWLSIAKNTKTLIEQTLLQAE